MNTTLDTLARTVMRPSEASRYLGLSTETLRAYRSRGCGPAYHKHADTGTIFYNREDLDAWVLSFPRFVGASTR